MTNVISILLKAKWTPGLYNCWVSPEGDVYTLTEGEVSPNVIINAIAKSHFNLDLVRAANHFDGKGIEEGIDFHATMAVLRSLKKDECYPYKCA